LAGSSGSRRQYPPDRGCPANGLSDGNNIGEGWPRARRAVILAWGSVIGLALGATTAVFPRWGLWWFTFSLGSMIALLMICYVAVPARLIGVRTAHSK
jgi:hypothetical protein